MSEQKKDEQWLDAELRQVINTTKPEFDAETWKLKHREAYQALLARQGQPDEPGAWTMFPIRHVAKLAFAAAIVVVGILAFRPPRPQANPQTGPGAGSPTEIQSAGVISFESLTLAFRRGGEEALNRQLDTAQETLGPRPDRSLLSDLLNDIRS